MPLSSPDSARLHLGAAYYLKHWRQEHGPEDIRLMREASLTMVRRGEFDGFAHY